MYYEHSLDIIPESTTEIHLAVNHCTKLSIHKNVTDSHIHTHILY